MAALTVLLMVCLAGEVLLLGAPSYHQERPTREEVAQWQASLGFVNLGNRIDVDPEMENVVDPSLEAELQQGRGQQPRRGQLRTAFGDGDDGGLDREHGLLFS